MVLDNNGNKKNVLKKHPQPADDPTTYLHFLLFAHTISFLHATIIPTYKLSLLSTTANNKTESPLTSRPSKEGKLAEPMEIIPWGRIDLQKTLL
ncbi:MAG: hypothetical protein Q8730_02665 [Sweet potato little leaf phytoplasma]|nr:hypothetical protein [Sweet potato little leaf phytoplasma]